MSAKGGKTGKSNKKFILLIVILVLIILGLSATVLYLWKQRPSGNVQKQGTGKSLVVDEDNADGVIGDLEEDSMDKMYNCRMSTSWTFEDGKAESKDAYVANTDYNHYTVYFEVQIDSTKEIVYTSPYLPVGSELNGLKLDHPLDAGKYPATVIYHLVDDDKKEVSTVGFTVTIQVLH